MRDYFSIILIPMIKTIFLIIFLILIYFYNYYKIFYHNFFSLEIFWSV